MDFETLWEKHTERARKDVNKRKGLKRGLAVICVVALIGIASFAVDYLWIRDKVDYPFVQDPEIVGTWEVVDFVKEIRDFSPKRRFWAEPFYFQKMGFTSSGECLVSKRGEPLVYLDFLKYTKGHILHSIDEVDCSYLIKELSNEKYLFFEWKSGDYSHRQQKPWYYVLKQVNTVDALDLVPGAVRQDQTDLPFVADPHIIGKWRVVAIQESAVEIEKDSYAYLEIKHSAIEFTGDGDVICSNLEDEPSAGRFKWTKGSIIYKIHPIVETYTIIEDAGKTYLLFPWIDEKVVNRGYGPSYYVLEKME